MTRRKHRSKAEWQDLVEQHERSGLNGVVFCEQFGLSRKTFYRHRKSMEQKVSDLATGQFIKVNPGPHQSMPVSAAVVLHYRDSRLQLPVGAEPTWVAELMKALA